MGTVAELGTSLDQEEIRQFSHKHSQMISRLRPVPGTIPRSNCRNHGEVFANQPRRMEIMSAEMPVPVARASGN